MSAGPERAGGAGAAARHRLAGAAHEAAGRLRRPVRAGRGRVRADLLQGAQLGARLPPAQEAPALRRSAPIFARYNYNAHRSIDRKFICED